MALNPILACLVSKLCIKRQKVVSEKMIRGRHGIYRTVLWSWRLRVANSGAGGQYQRTAAFLHGDPAPQAAEDGAVSAETLPSDTGDTIQTHLPSEPRLCAQTQPTLTSQPSTEDHLSSQTQVASLRHFHTAPVLFDTHRAIQELQRGGGRGLVQ